MDPQERLFLQTAAAVLEDAGYPADRLAAQGPVGVFAGVMSNDYAWLGGEADALGVPTDAHSHHWSVANRVSAFFDFTGPSLAVDTACSASLTAVHLACQSIRAGECTAALAGGVNLILHPQHLRGLARAGMLSRGDRLKAFGAEADGFVDGEGVGAVLLKPLAAAVADGDRVLGVLGGSAVNAGGDAGGYTVPKASAQAEVVRAALERAGFDAESVGYVEAHGTGTHLGDPIEVAGLVEAFGGPVDPAHREQRPTTALGSVKTNIGHLEAAAGIAGLTKVLLQFRHRKLAPSLHAERRNPEIDFGSTPFEVQQCLEPWPRRGSGADDAAADAAGGASGPPLRALVSSFGAGGAGRTPAWPWRSTCRPGRPNRRRTPGNSCWCCRPGARSGWVPTRRTWRPSCAVGGGPDRSGPESGAAAEAEELCVRALAAEVAGVRPGSLEAADDLVDCGFGLAERAHYFTLLSEELGAELPPAVQGADTIGGRRRRGDRTAARYGEGRRPGAAARGHRPHPAVGPQRP